MKLSEDIHKALGTGLASARANLVPMVVLWMLAGVSVGAYYLLAPFRGMFEPMADWQRAWGWRAAFVSQAVFCGILPGVFLLAIRSIRPRHPFLTILAQSLWCGGFGVCNNEVFHLMARVLGDNAHVSTVLAKAAFDQFVWTVAVIAPAIVTFSFPFSLQIHVNGIVCTFWTLMCVQIGRRT